MAIKITCGTVKLDSQQPLFALAHGGAGPQDPKGQKLAMGQEKMKTLLNELDLAQTLPTLSTSQWNQLSSAFQLSLKAAEKLEADPFFNAGRGASLQQDGIARVSAACMESRLGKFSGVINTQDLIHPSHLAAYLQYQVHSVLDGTGAGALIRELNLPLNHLITQDRLTSWLEFKKKSLHGKNGTIGCVSANFNADLAAVTSTGGVGNEKPGRVGDSPTIAGNYCSSQTAVSCTGYGEQIVSLATAPQIAFRAEQAGSLESALQSVLEQGLSKQYSFALIALHRPSGNSTLQWAAGAVNCDLLWTKVH